MRAMLGEPMIRVGAAGPLSTRGPLDEIRRHRPGGAPRRAAGLDRGGRGRRRHRRPGRRVSARGERPSAPQVEHDRPARRAEARPHRCRRRGQEHDPGVEHVEAGRVLRSEESGRRRRPRPKRRPAARPRAAGARAGRRRSAARGGEAAPAAPAAPAVPAGGGNFLAFANSDLAFKGVNVVMGNFHGFNTYNVEDAQRPKLVASIACPGGQGDVSIYGNLLFMSVEQTRGRIDCGTQGVAATVSTERFRGVRIFDITDLKNPKQVAAVQTCRGSHTHTLVPAEERPEQHLRLRLGHRQRALGRGAGRLLGPQAGGGSEHRALQHRRHQGAARRTPRRRRSSPGRASSPTPPPAPSPACGPAAITVPAPSAPAPPTSATTSR